jgi:hypothetical protein
MCFVLRAFGRRADPDRAPERVVDIGRVIGRLVVEEEREGRRAGGEDARVERRDDRGAVLFVTDRRADERGGVRVDVELHVEDEAFAAEDDRHLHSVADPLSGLIAPAHRDPILGRDADVDTRRVHSHVRAGRGFMVKRVRGVDLCHLRAGS